MCCIDRLKSQPKADSAEQRLMSENQSNDLLSRGDRLRIFGAVLVAIIVIATVGYWVFDMPLWVAVVGALVGVFVNGLITLVEKH
jgi:RsiW-degrading membrane proteinase PrsW (M82 family)